MHRNHFLVVRFRSASGRQTENNFALTANLAAVVKRAGIWAVRAFCIFAAATAFEAKAGVVFTSLHSFQLATNGSGPMAPLIQASDGNFYGTTYTGGTNGGKGTVFKMTSSGTVTALHSFSGGSRGGSSAAGLVQGTNGFLYGVTSAGGASGLGTVFKTDTTGALTTVHTFTAADSGGNPLAGLMQASDGNFYGTTYSGVAAVTGTVFRMTSAGALTDIHEFPSDVYAGSAPQGTLVQGSDGSLYGTTAFSYTEQGGNGTIFKVTTNGTFTLLYDFDEASGNESNGEYPQAGLTLGTDGKFYGTTYVGGDHYSGVIFVLTGSGLVTNLYSFTGGVDGGYPQCSLVQGADGNFYGTTSEGGDGGYGTVFVVTPSGALRTLYPFTGGDDGGNPAAGLVQGTNGNFFGTTAAGGADGLGTLFEITTNGNLTTLYQFTEINDGASPSAPLIEGRDGNFYSTTFSGGTNGGNGTLFSMSPDGIVNSLYSFAGSDEGAGPSGGLALGNDGKFYGTTEEGGTNRAGTMFRFDTNGGVVMMHSFTGGPGGAVPEGGLFLAADGNFYGTAQDGGTGLGIIFKISPGGVFGPIYSFTGANDGGLPDAGLVQGSGGTLYGTTQIGGSARNGTIFEIATNGGLTPLFAFPSSNPDDDLNTSLVQASNGNFYGTTGSGGAAGYGVIYKMTPNGSVTNVYSFTNGIDGERPLARLLLAEDGNLYGTTTGGGAYGNGTVFQATSNGSLTTLYSFTGGNDGQYPVAALIQGSDGYFYGTTSEGGSGASGTVFRFSFITPQPASIASVAVSGSNLVLNCINGESGTVYYALVTTNLTLPVTRWTPVSTNVLGASGSFVITATNAFNKNTAAFFCTVTAY